MKNKKTDYFALLEEQSTFCAEAAALTEEVFREANEKTIAGYRQKMHEIENRADEVCHQICNLLAAAFITPIDQEDILHLVQRMDDITDEMDEAVLKFYIFGAGKSPAFAARLAEKVRRCVTALAEAVRELRHFKKPKALRESIIAVNTAEGEADKMHLEALRNLFATEQDFKTLLVHKEIYDSLENCCDLCEHATDIMEQIILKNA